MANSDSRKTTDVSIEVDRDLTPKEVFLLKEYDSATALGMHLDNLRSRITYFFVVISGAAAAGVAGVLKLIGQSVPWHWQYLSAMLLIAVAGFGWTCVFLIAKVRRAQLEAYQISNNIREYFIRDDFETWDVVVLSGKTLPQSRRRNGSTVWAEAIGVFTAILAGGGVYVTYETWARIREVPDLGWLGGIVTAFVIGALLRNKYHGWAEYVPPPRYSQGEPPWRAASGADAPESSTQL